MKKEANIYTSNPNNRKFQIVKAAAFLFNEKGYERTTLKDIAGKIGITKATLYHYFKSKHDLLFHIIDESITDATRRMSHILDSPVGTNEKIDLAFRQHFQFYLTKYPGASVMLHEKTDLLPSEQEKIIKEKFREYITFWEKILEEGCELGIIRQDLDTKIMRWAAIGMCNWVYKWASSEGRQPFDQIAGMFSELFKTGVLKK